MAETVAYPIGLQDFNTLRNENYVYIDKTQYIEQLIKTKPRYCFLARPRRFGKSLFLSTLQCFFEGKRDLFKGLYIDSMDWEWEEYPVLRLDLNYNSYEESGQLDSVLNTTFTAWEEKYGVVVSVSISHPRPAASKTGKSEKNE